MTRGRKILIGCVVVLGAMVFSAVAGVALFFRWLQTPGDPLEGNRLINNETRTYVEMRLEASNPGAHQIVRTLIQAQQQLQARPDDLPPFLAFLQNVPQRPDQTISDAEMDELLPLAAIFTAQSHEASPGGGMSFTINLPSAANSFRLVDRFMAFGASRTDDVEYLLYQDEAYYRFGRDDGDLWISIVDANLVFSLLEPPMRSTIDRLSRPAEVVADSTPPLAALLTGAPPDHVFRFASQGQTVEMLEMLSHGLPELAALLRQLVGDSRTVTGWLRVEAGDALTGEFQAENALAAGESSGPLRIGDTIRLELYNRQVRLTLAPIRASRAGWSAWRLRAEGVLVSLMQGLQEAVDEQSAR